MVGPSNFVNVAGPQVRKSKASRIRNRDSNREIARRKARFDILHNVNHQRVELPMEGIKKSLNVSVCGGVVLYHLASGYPSLKAINSNKEHK